MEAGTSRKRVVEHEQDNTAGLAKRIFYLEWYDAEGTLCHGTGFFLTPTIALTAYHNLPPEVLARRGREASEHPIRAKRGADDIDLYWILPEDRDRHWQILYQLAVLETREPQKELPALPCFFLSSTLERGEREDRWRRRDLLLSGFPKSDDYAQTMLPCKVSWENPIRNTARLIHGRRKPYVPDAVALLVDTDDSLSGLRGMSGGPVYDPGHGGVVGLLVGVDKKAFATELVHLIKNHEPAREWLTELKFESPPPPPPPPPQKRRWWLWVLLLAVLAAPSFWLWRRQVPERLAVDVIHLTDGHRSKLPGDRVFTEGEHVRFAITAPATGHLYIVDREISSGGQERPSYLIFPTRRSGLGRNRVTAGTPVLYPSEDDDPPYVTPKPRDGDADYGGEMLTVLVFRDPLPFELGDAPLRLKPSQIPMGELIPRIFDQPVAAPLAMEQIRVAVRRAAR